LEELIAKLKIENQVILLGAQEQNKVKCFLLSSDLYILTSVTADNGDQEGIPVSLMEAMSVGLPVISSIHSGIPELINDQKSGFLVPEKNIDEISEKIELLMSDPDLRFSMGKEGRRIVSEYFNIQTLSIELEKIYRNLLADK